MENKKSGPRDEFEVRQDAAEIEAEGRNFNNEEPPDCLTCDRTGVCLAGCIEMLGIDPFKVNEPTSRIIKTLKIAMDYGTVQGDQHRAFAIDQMVRALSGDQYENFIKQAAILDKGIG